jgi:hypothetical protein
MPRNVDKEPVSPCHGVIYSSMNWFKAKHPDFATGISEHQLNQFVTTLIEVKDVFLACKLVRRIAGMKPDEELIRLLLADYNEHTLDQLEAAKLITPRDQR